MAKHNIEYKMIDHKEWSKLKGIRQQVAFIKKLLGKLWCVWVNISDLTNNTTNLGQF